MSDRRRVVITGGLGKIGQCLYDGLSAAYQLVLLDRVAAPVTDFPDAELVVGDLGDVDSIQQVFEGADAVVHLAAYPVEAPFDQIVADNIVTAHRVYEAAKRAMVRRVVFASTNHVTGFYPREQSIDPDAPARPDTFYGVSKAFGEDLGRLYADKYGLDVICVRIASFCPVPTDIRHLSTWLSPRDCQGLFTRCIEAPPIGHLVVYGVSGNTRRWWRSPGWDVLGFDPQDDAEAFASKVGPEPGVVPGSPSALHQGGWFAEVQPAS